MDLEICDERLYFFGKDESNLKVIQVSNGGYLNADRIKHYEDCFGPLYSVKYRGKTVLA